MLPWVNGHTLTLSRTLYFDNSHSAMNVTMALTTFAENLQLLLNELLRALRWYIPHLTKTPLAQNHV